MEACQHIPNWKKNDHIEDQYGNKRSWFECGTFYFDGVFNVVKFPKGMSLYHGSPTLVWYNAVAPVGSSYYISSDENKMTQDEKSKLRDPKVSTEEKRKLLKSKQAMSTGWFGDLNIAQRYSADFTVPDPKTGEKRVCGNNCIAAFKLTRDAVFVDIYDPFNLTVLVNSDMPKYLKDILVQAQITGTRSDSDPTNHIRDAQQLVNQKLDPDTTSHLQYAFHPMKRFLAKTRRQSMRRRELPDQYVLPNFLVREFTDMGYAGFINPETPYLDSRGEQTGRTRFGEIVFGKSLFEYVKRDYFNEYDWQYNALKGAPETVKKLINDMGKYATSNIDFHAGDLLDHSVWTMFYADHIYMGDSKYRQWAEGIPRTDSMRKFISTVAFLHDIGKGGDDDYLYYDKPDHPEVGSGYIDGNLDYRLADGTSLNVMRVLSELGVGPPYDRVISVIVSNHWLFGEVMIRINKDGLSISEGAKQYVNVVMKDLYYYRLSAITEDPKSLDLFFRILMLVSAADVLGSQPFNTHVKFRNLSDEIKLATRGISRHTDKYIATVNKLPKVKINERSEVFPFLSNRSQVHRGGLGTNYQRFKYDDTGLSLRSEVLKLVRPTR